MVFQSLARGGRHLPRLLGVLMLTAAGVAQAGVGLVWDLSDWSYTLAPDQTLVLHATVYNEASATEHLLGSRFVGFYAEGIESAYDFVAPAQSLAEQFAALDLAPGQGMDFVFGSLVPVGGQVAPGHYTGGAFALAFQDASGAEVSWSPEHTLAVSVEAGDPGQTVPEPGSLALAAASLGLLAWQRRRPSHRPE